MRHLEKDWDDGSVEDGEVCRWVDGIANVWEMWSGAVMLKMRFGEVEVPSLQASGKCHVDFMVGGRRGVGVHFCGE